MIRKIAFTLAAVAALGTASLVTSTTEASAGWKHKHHHHHHGHGHGHWRGGGFGFYGGPVYAAGYGYGCYVRRVVATPWGPRVRRVNVCY